MKRGEDHGRNKLTENQVIEIIDRLAAGERVKDLAAAFGVGARAISYIRQGKNWKHVARPEGMVQCG